MFGLNTYLNLRIKNNNPNARAMAIAMPKEANIPYAPNAMSKKGSASLITLSIVFFMKMYFVER